MKISYAITVCNELDEIKKLITILLNSKRDKDEIVVLFDSKNGSPEVWEYLNTLNIIIEKGLFENHFANWKNKLTKLCTGDYIFQLDADEYPHLHLLNSLPSILKSNPVDLIRVPRVNTVKGLTTFHIQSWGWNLNKDNWINWPDMQWRIYKNNPKIQWEGNVHEKIIGYETFAELPPEEAYALYHPKDIKRQEKQNKYYSTL
mgnify:FL=1|jgi:hypothetical protein